MGNSASNAASKSEVTSLKNTVESLKSQVTKLQGVKVDEKILKDIKIDYAQLGQMVKSGDVAEGILKDPRPLIEAVVPKIAANEGTVTNLSLKLADNPTVAKTLADKLTEINSKYISALRGEKGASGDLAIAEGDTLKKLLKQKMYDTKVTMWCADGEICKLPVGVPNIQPNDGSLSLNVDGNWGGLSIWNKKTNKWNHIGHPDGSNYLRGNTFIEGNLSTNGQTNANGNVRVYDGAVLLDNDNGGRVYAKNRVQIGDWIIYQRGDGHLGFWKDGDRYAMNKDYPGGTVVNTSKSYGIRSARGGYLSDQGGWKGKPEAAHFWEVMKLDELPF